MSLTTRKRAAAILATGALAGAAGVAAADNAEPEPVTSPYFDLEANKAASMRALGRHLAAQRAPDDLQADKSRAQHALWKRAKQLE